MNGMPDSDLDFYEIRKKLVGSGSLFIDPEFPPDIKSIYPTGRGSRNSNIHRIVWKRPTQISEHPKFISSTATRSDLDQGQLGDCWFVAAASLLVNGPRQQFERVVPQDQGFDKDYAGIFHFRFWWYGSWKDIIIDDYLPTDGHRLLFCYNWEEIDEFWGALLEKAYAKLRGSYDALDGGKLTDAMVDMSGGLSERINLTKKGEVSPDLYDLLWKTSQMNSLIGGSIYLPEGSTRPEVRRDNGLYMGHAYSITAISQVPLNNRKYRLLRLRNPWGRKEWNGPCSYEIRNLPMEVKRKLKIINKLNWSVTLYHDAWIKGVTAGGCGNAPHQDLYWRNPQFQVHLVDVDTTDGRDLCTMVVSLMEKEKGGSEAGIAIGFDVYEVKGRQTRPLDGVSLPRSALKNREGSGTYEHYREVTRRFEYKPGYYVVIPSSFYPNQEADFMLRIYTEKEVESEVMDENGSPTQPPSRQADPLDALFRKYAGEDNEMDFRELRDFLTEASLTVLDHSLRFSRESCRCLVTLMDRNRSGFLSLEQAKDVVSQMKAYAAVFRKSDINNSDAVDTMELESIFKQLGFPVSRMVLTSIVRRYGGRDRRISLQDFIIVMCKLVVMFGIFKEQQIKTGGQTDVAQFTRNEFLQYSMFC
ncbi:CAN8-like protein [Mya arenaria]|uniref:CAN8-like protein n=1 Tax=Mya arenaria TaxID=6604 RepID=A0ABY7DMA0_MYAAR|nr:CAN8-like protein [Mya arenaria]